MNNAKYTVTGYILAGGKSSRMMTDKGLLLFKGKAIIQHIIEQLQPVTGKVVIVSNNHEYEKFGLDVIPDIVSDIGPAGGIYTALSNSNTDQNFLISCDMPFVTSEAIEFIIQNANQSQITLPFHEHKLEPLFGVYSTSCFAQWELLIQKGILKLQDMITYFDLRQLNVDNNQLFNKNIFININTPEDFKEYNN